MALPDVVACELCGQPANVLVRMRSGMGFGRETQWWCVPCRDSNPHTSDWAAEGEPVDIEAVYRKQLAELRKDLQALQREVDMATDEDERARAERNLAHWLGKHDEYLQAFRESGWRIPNPKWALKTARDRLTAGQVLVDQIALDGLKKYLAIEQWALEPDPNSQVKLISVEALKEPFVAALRSLNRKLYAPLPKHLRWDEKISLKLETPAELWLLHELAAWQVEAVTKVLGQQQADADVFQKVLQRWEDLRDSTVRPPGVFVGARLIRLESAEKRAERERAEKAQGLWKMTMSTLTSCNATLGNGAPPGKDVFDLGGGLIWGLEECIRTVPGLKPEARRHLETLLQAARDLRSATDEFKKWMNAQAPS